MKNLLTLLSIFISTALFAKIVDYAPQNFTCGKLKCVYVDFEKVNYKITYDLSQKKVSVESTINFISNAAGIPLFDLAPEISGNQVMLDGKFVKVLNINDPDRESMLRAANITLAAGPHELKLKHIIDRGVKFDKTGVRSAFWMTDLSDRGYLERFLPTNLEYDQYEMSIELKLINYRGEQDIFTNGLIKQIDHNSWTIHFPKYFTASSMFYHIAPKGYHKRIDFNFTSNDGRQVPVTIYSKRTSLLTSLKVKTLSVLKEYERDFGRWPHQKIIIYGAGSGGMEYSGATMTSLRALGHELNHSYFARGIMPSSGNTGWIDEAIASWRDDGSKRASRRSGGPMGSLGGHSQYRRSTDMGAYSKGSKFMSILDLVLKDKGGLKSFLAHLVEQKMYKSINTKEFQNILEKYHGNSLQKIFNQTIYGRFGKKNVKIKNLRSIINPYHPKLTQEELDDLL